MHTTFERQTALVAFSLLSHDKKFDALFLKLSNFKQRPYFSEADTNRVTPTPPTIKKKWNAQKHNKL